MAVYAAIRSNRKDNREETTKDVTAMTTVIVKLENIAAGVTEIKGDFKSMKMDFEGLRERVAKCEESTKSSHKRMDDHCTEDHHA